MKVNEFSKCLSKLTCSFFPRKNPSTDENSLTESYITCNTYALKEAIAKWLSEICSDWNFSNFAVILESLKVSLPVKLNLIEIRNGMLYFSCMDATNSDINITLSTGDFIEYNSEITLELDYETRKYEIYVESGSTTPILRLKEREVFQDGKSLTNTYYEAFASRMLYFDTTHILQINIKYELPDYTNELVLKNYEVIDDYLLSLTSTSDVSEIYNTLLSLFNYSVEEYATISTLTIAQLDSYNSEERIHSIIKTEYGKIVEFALTENDQTFHIFSNKNWKYYSNNVKINYNAEKDLYELTLIGNYEMFSNFEIKNLIDLIKGKISVIFEKKFSPNI